MRRRTSQLPGGTHDRCADPLRPDSSPARSSSPTEESEVDQALTVVLVHGAGTGPWIWRRLQDALSLPTLSVTVDSRRKGASPGSCAAGVVQEIDAAGADRVVLVLHSLGGVLAPSLADLLGDRIERTIFLAAVVPSAGKRFVDALGFPGGLVLRILFRFRPRGLTPPEHMIRTELCSDLSDADTTTVIDAYRAEWPGLYLTPVEDARHVPRPLYIRLTRDQSIPLSLQDSAIENLPDPAVVDLAAGHLAMLSRPGELGRLVMKAIGPP